MGVIKNSTKIYKILKTFNSIRIKFKNRTQTRTLLANFPIPTAQLNPNAKSINHVRLEHIKKIDKK